VTARDDRLRELAMAATPGPWEADEPATKWRARDGHVRTTHPDFEDCADEIAETFSNDDAAYIAAASPDVVTGLLDRLAAVEAERDRLAAAVERVEALAEIGVTGWDLTPTVSGSEDPGWWYAYLRSLDSQWRSRLRAALSDAGSGK
jgi:hypothetical protein